MSDLTGPATASEVALLREQVSLLQIASAEKKKPFWQTPTNIVSALAFVFSLGTTAVSYVRTSRAEVHAARVELRGLLSRLAMLPREFAENAKKYETDASTRDLVGGQINQENSLLARQAAEIAARLPLDQMTATEAYSIGWALMGSLDNAGARVWAGRAIDTPGVGVNDLTAALRMRANLGFIMGQPEAGRVDYQRALKVFSDKTANDYTDFTIRSFHITTEIGWALSECGIGNVGGYAQHLAEAEKLLAGIPFSPGYNQVAGPLMALRAQPCMPQGAPLAPARKP